MNLATVHPNQLNAQIDISFSEFKTINAGFFMPRINTKHTDKTIHTRGL